MSRNDRPPMPPPANAAMTSSRSSARRASSGPRGIDAARLCGNALAVLFETVALELEEPARLAAHQHTGQHTDRSPLVDALPHDRAIGLDGNDLVHREHACTRRLLFPRPPSA